MIKQSWGNAGSSAGEAPYEYYELDRFGQGRAVPLSSMTYTRSGLVDHMVRRFGLEPSSAALVADDVLKIISGDAPNLSHAASG